MYRILLTDMEYQALNGERIDSVVHMTSAEMQLGYLLGRAVYLEGMMVGEYQKPADPATIPSNTPNSTSPDAVQGNVKDSQPLSEVDPSTVTSANPG